MTGDNMRFPPKLKALGYTEEELELDSPHHVELAPDPLDQALEYLNQLVAGGVEYPDAEWKAVRRFGVSQDALAEAYDTQL